MVLVCRGGVAAVARRAQPCAVVVSVVRGGGAAVRANSNFCHVLARNEA
jgi:hypothetical protein